MKKWERPLSLESLTSTFNSELEALSSSQQLVIDLGRCWPGDLIAENFIENDLGQAKWFLEILIEACFKKNIPLVFRFTDLKSHQGFMKVFATQTDRASLKWAVEESQASLSFADAYMSFSKIKNRVIWSVHDLICLLEKGKRATKTFEQKDVAISLPLCLWGDVQALGHHWVNYDQSLTEIFEMTGLAGPRPQFVLVNGPIGELMPWGDIKNKSLSSLSSSLDLPSHEIITKSVRSLHFFASRNKGIIQKVWNEFFREDKCFHCLPCRFAREQMTEDHDVSTFRGSAAYQCHFPHLYRKADTFHEILSQDSIDKTTGSIKEGGPL
jgi:hypothetical protein